MNNKKWYDNEKDIATKPIFHIVWFGVWCSALVIGSKGVAYSLGWESYLIAIFSCLMLTFQVKSLVDVLEEYNKIRNSKQRRSKK